MARQGIARSFTREIAGCVPHLSIDCAVFGFHDGDLRLLLLKWAGADRWSLPGGYVRWSESLDDAAARVLRLRTGLRKVHLRQFHTFGSLRRREASLRPFFARLGVPVPRDAWPLKRVVSVGYYALVDFQQVSPSPDSLSDLCAWYPLRDRPPLAFDHDTIVEVALRALRQRLDSPGAGATLMPARFTMPELQRLHEAILGVSLDRRNFQKRMLERGGLERLAARRTGGAHRAPFLYRFVRRRPADGF